jgi:RimJ/RimL family protein N-acetyltransferase
MLDQYLFMSERLGFRNWRDSDLSVFAEMNADPEVMRFFPNTLSTKESGQALKQYQEHFHERGYTYYAVESLQTTQFIGFIGLKYQNFESPCTPAVDIGWRILRQHWGKGYASEGARRCLGYAFKTLGLDQVVSHCPTLNKPSERVMQKIGMARQGEFLHPLLEDFPDLNPCVWYEMKKA